MATAQIRMHHGGENADPTKQRNQNIQPANRALVDFYKRSVRKQRGVVSAPYAKYDSRDKSRQQYVDKRYNL